MVVNNMFDKKLFGQKVKYYRNKQGLTLDNLSEKAGIGLNYLADIKQGRHVPTLKTIIGIVNSLDVTYTALTSNQTEDDTLIQSIESKIKSLDDRAIRLLISIVKNYTGDNKND